MTHSLELSHLRLRPLTESESKDTSGGIFWIPVAVGTTLLLSAINNFGDIRQGLVDGFNGTPRYTN